MRIISSVSFLFFLTLKSFVIIGDAYPIIDSKNENIVKDANITEKSANISITDENTPAMPYICVYIPPNLAPCKFNSTYRYNNTKLNFGNQKHISLKKIKREMSKNNQIFDKPLLTLSSETDKHKTILIYEIQNCVPPRLLNIFPGCTDEDIANKNSILDWLYPFWTKDTSKSI